MMSLRGTKCRSNLKKDVIGVDISQDRVAVAVVRVGDKPEIKEVENRLAPKGSSDEELSGIIKEIFARKGLSKKEVWLNISTNSRGLIVSRASLPVMPQKDVLNAVRWNLKDKLPFDVNTAEFAYEVIGEAHKEDGSKARDIIACAAERPLLDKYLNIFKRAGVALTGINILPFSVSNALRSDLTRSGKTGSVIVCSIDMEYTYLCFYWDSALTFVRQVPLGSSSFINAIIGVLASDKGKIELSYEDARKIISETGIPKDKDDVSEGKITTSQLLALVRPVIEQFAGEITRSIDYYQREFAPAEAGADKVGALLIAGEGAGVKGFISFLSEYLSMKVEPLELPEGSLFLAAAGAALSHGGKINLLPREVKMKKGRDVTKTAIRVIAIAVFGVLLVSFLTVKEQIKNYRKELEIVKKQRIILADVKDMREKIAERQAIISGITNKDVPMDLALKELSNVTPGNIAFSRLWINRGQHTLKITGRVSARPEDVQGVLSDFMTKLEKTALIRDANLLNAQKETLALEEISVFEISCVLKN